MRTQTYKPTKLELWTKASNYAGQTFEDYFECAGQHRDSDLMERSNFAAILDRLGGESETVLINRASHWAVGWVETILIHKSDAKALKEGDAVWTELEEYPILDECDYYDRKSEDLHDTLDFHREEFRKVVVKGLANATDVPVGLLNSLADAGKLDGIIRDALGEDDAWCGDAWVTDESFARYIKNEAIYSDELHEILGA